jgi:hypothetical protein
MRKLTVNREQNHKYIVVMRSYIFCNINPCNPVKDISIEYTACNFRVEKARISQPKAGSKQSSSCSAHHDAFIRNLCSLSPE